MLDLIKVLTVR